MFDIHQSFSDADTGEIDHDAFRNYVDELSEEFADSPEGEHIADQFGETGWAETMMGFAVDYLGCTPPEMSAADMREILFSLFPRKVSVEPEKAVAIVSELRAFWLFLRRSYALKNAGAILAVLSESAIPRLRRELADPANFGMAKSFFTKGAELGFDMTNQEGLNKFMDFYNANLAGRQNPGLFSPLIPYAWDDAEDGDDEEFEDDDAPLLPSHTPAERAEMRKKKRKVERQARKRNRRA